MRGTILRIADLRFQSAYIRVTVRRSTSSQPMVEFSLVPHQNNTGIRRSSRYPEIKAICPHGVVSTTPRSRVSTVC